MLKPSCQPRHAVPPDRMSGRHSKQAMADCGWRQRHRSWWGGQMVLGLSQHAGLSSCTLVFCPLPCHASGMMTRCRAKSCLHTLCCCSAPRPKHGPCGRLVGTKGRQSVRRGEYRTAVQRPVPRATGSWPRGVCLHTGVNMPLAVRCSNRAAAGYPLRGPSLPSKRAGRGCRAAGLNGLYISGAVYPKTQYVCMYVRLNVVWYVA